MSTATPNTPTTTRSHLILILGDIHSPHRSRQLPQKFQELLSQPQKIHYVLCTGNLCDKATEKYLTSICKTPQNVFIVNGDMDQGPISSRGASSGTGASYPQHEVLEIGSLRFGLVHGHQIVPWDDKESLAAFARKLNVDVLVSGHTHQQQTYEYQGRYFINPGSATGAYTPLKGPSDEVVPSFVLVQAQGDAVIVFKYQLKNGEELVVQKAQFTKVRENGASA